MLCIFIFIFYFFIQPEDGIRDYKVTGVQTCALPISPALSAGRPCRDCALSVGASPVCVACGACRRMRRGAGAIRADVREIGRASCRERVEVWGETDGTRRT